MTEARRKSLAKAIFQKALIIPGITLPFSVLLRNRAVILMYHRFRVPDLGIDGHDPANVAEGLQYLRRNHYEIVSLRELFNRLAEGRSVRGAIALTIDDGYQDHGSVAAEIFAKYDCPVTTFVTTGFLDGTLWFWWDKIEYVLNRTSRRELHLKLAEKEIQYTREEGSGWQKAREGFIALCKNAPDLEKTNAISYLSLAADVAIPAKPPTRYAPMSWDQARKCEQLGMTFGPHTVTHPILSNTPDDQCAQEIADSWNRLREMVARPVPIFCYPNGGAKDFGSREIRFLREAGLAGAVTGISGYPVTGSLQPGTDAPYRLARFGYPPALSDLIQIVGGVVRFREILRGAA